MTVRAETRVFARSAPFMFVRGTTETVLLPIRDPGTGALVAPTQGAGSTITITRADGTKLVDAQTVTVTNSIARYDVTTSSTDTLGKGWQVEATLAFPDSAPITVREAAYLCQYIPPCNVSALDLYRGPGGIPELEGRVPQSQGTRGDATYWQPQIDAAYWQLLRFLVSNDRGEPWLIREVSGYYEVLCAWAQRNALATVEAAAGTAWEQYRKDNYFACQRAEAALRLQYSDDDPGVRRAAASVIRLAPIGRPRW